MASPRNQLNGTSPPQGALFQGPLVDRTLVFFTAIGVCIFVLIHVRSYYMGWHARDAVQALMLGALILATFCRRRLSINFKVIFLALLSAVIGFAGLFSLGFMGAGIWFFPAATVILSLLYSKRIVVTFSILSVIGIVLIAVWFSRGVLKPTINPGLLMTSLSHWITYILCIALFFAICVSAILFYRKAVTGLFTQVEEQRSQLKERNAQLEKALSAIRKLEGILPVCSYCKKVRDSKGSWNQIEVYIREHSEADFSHGICPECARKYFPEIPLDEDS